MEQSQISNSGHQECYVWALLISLPFRISLEIILKIICRKFIFDIYIKEKYIYKQNVHAKLYLISFWKYKKFIFPPILVIRVYKNICIDVQKKYCFDYHWCSVPLDLLIKIFAKLSLWISMAIERKFYYCSFFFILFRIMFTFRIKLIIIQLFFHAKFLNNQRFNIIVIDDISET